MNELKQKSWLLILLAVLVVIKFIIVPIIDWQTDSLSEIALQQKKLNKMQYLLNNQQKITDQNRQIQHILDTAQTYFFHENDEASFKLNQQKLIEQLITKFSLSSQHIGWSEVIERSPHGIDKYQVEIKVKGKTVDVIRLMADIESHTPRIAISNFNLSLNNKLSNDLGTTDGKISLELFNYLQNNQKDKNDE
jgi:hypothetical protein